MKRSLCIALISIVSSASCVLAQQAQLPYSAYFPAHQPPASAQALGDNGYVPAFVNAPTPPARQPMSTNAYVPLFPNQVAPQYQNTAPANWMVPQNGSYPPLQPIAPLANSSYPQAPPLPRVSPSVQQPFPQVQTQVPVFASQANTSSRPFGMASVQSQQPPAVTMNSSGTFQFAEATAGGGHDAVQAPVVQESVVYDDFGKGCAPQCGFWEVSADLLALRRSGLHPYGLITPTAVGSPTLDVSDLNFDFALGMQASLARHTASGTSIEARALWVDNWSDSRRIAGDLALEGPGFQLAVAPGEFDVYYDSSLVGVELNFGDFLCGHCGYFWGLRWLRFNDHLLVNELDLPVAGALDMETRNDLIGFQAGRLFRVADIGRFRSRVFAKGGVYYNFVETNIQSSFLGPPIQDTDYDVAFIGEFGIDAAYCINDCLRVRVAYEIIGVSQVATSTDQIPASDLSTGIAGINTNGMFFDGGYVGFEWIH